MLSTCSSISKTFEQHPILNIISSVTNNLLAIFQHALNWRYYGKTRQQYHLIHHATQCQINLNLQVYSYILPSCIFSAKACSILVPNNEGLAWAYWRGDKIWRLSARSICLSYNLALCKFQSCHAHKPSYRKWKGLLDEFESLLHLTMGCQ